MKTHTAYVLLTLPIVLLGCASDRQSDNNDVNSKKDFAHYYGDAVISSDFYNDGMRYLKEQDYPQAIIAFEQSLVHADSKPAKSMSYAGLAATYKAMGEREREIFYLSMEADNVLNIEYREELLRKIEQLRRTQ